MSDTPFPQRLLTAGMVVTLAVLGTLAAQAWRSYQGVVVAQEIDLRLAELAGDIRHLDEVLTMSARMAAATGDLGWETRYRAGEARLDAAIREARALVPRELDAFVAQTDTANVELVEMENQAFALVRSGDAAQASVLLSDPAYERRKQTYSRGLTLLTHGMQARIRVRLLAQRRRAMIAVQSAGGAFALVALIWLRLLVDVRAHLAAGRRAEQAEREAARLAAVQTTTATLHHEINNPLQIIMGKTEAALERVPEDERDGLRTVLTSAEQIADLIRKLERVDRVDTQPYVGDHLMLDVGPDGSSAAQPSPPPE